MEDIPYKSESHPPMTLRSPTIQEGTTAGGRRENEKLKMKSEVEIESWKVKSEKPCYWRPWSMKNEKWIGKLKHYCPLKIAKRSLVDSNDK